MKYMILLFLLIGIAHAQNCIVNDALDGFETCAGMYQNPNGCNFYYAAGRWVDEYQSFKWSSVFETIGNGSIVSCSLFGKRSLDCEMNVGSNNTLIKFIGTDDFCAKYRCGSDIFGACDCSLGELEEYAFVLVDGEWARIENQKGMICAERYLEPVIQTNGKRSGRNILSFNGIPETVVEIVNVQLDKPIMTLGFVNSAQRFVLVYSGSYSQYFSSNGSMMTIELPDSVMIKSGRISYTVYNSAAGIINSGHIDYVADFLCRIKDCTFCMDAFNNWDCVPLTSKILAIFLIVLCGILLLAISPWGILGLVTVIMWVLKILYYFLYFSLWLIKKSWAVSMNNRISKYILEVKRNFMSEVNSVKQDEEKQSLKELSEIEEVAKREAGINMPRGSRMYTTFFFVCLISSSMACDSLIIGTASYYSCNSPSAQELVSGTQTCKAQFSITATLPFLGSQVCIDLKDQNGNFITSFNVTYTNAREYVSISLDYVTAGWTPYAQSAYKCWGTTECSGTNCENPGANGYGLLSGIAVQYPGQTTCRYSGGCAGNGCFFCSPGCVYSAWGLKPYGDTFSVYRPTTTRLEPSVSFCRQNATNSLGVSCNDILQSSGSVTSIDASGVQIVSTVVGTLTGAATIFGTNKIVARSANDASIQPAADPNSPVGGGIGDVQGNPSQFWTAARSAFVYATGLYTVAQGETVDTYTFRNNGIEVYGVGVTKLPGVYGGVLYKSDITNGRIYGDKSQPGALVVNFRTGGNITFTQKTTWVCPEARLVTVSGCFSCTTGSSLVLELRSSCFDGLMRIGTAANYITISTGSIATTTVKKNYTINFVTSNEFNTFSLWVWGSGGNVSIPVTYTAVSVMTIVNSTYNGNVTEIINKESGLAAPTGNSFTDFFTNDIPKFFDDIVAGVASWRQYLVFALLIAGGIGLILAIAIPTRNLIMRYTEKIKLARKTLNQMKDAYGKRRDL